MNPVFASAATLEPVGTYSSPVFVISEPPDPDRILVVEQGGRIQLTEGGSTSLFLNISSLVTPGGEQGLLSMAPAPDYATTHLFYVFYVNTRGDLQIDEFTASSIPVDMATRRPVLTVPHPVNGNHNGGQLQFGPDGYLYISTGDGGGGGDAGFNGQDPRTLLGKILRIDPRASAGSLYAVPPDNPFVGVAGADEVWSYGLRNPFRFSFDRLTGALLIGDVGQGSREEVDFEPQPNAGRADNFGWSCREGFAAYTDATPDPACTGGDGASPTRSTTIAHAGGNCSITGGYVSRDTGVPELDGRYLYADHCVGQIRSLVPGLPLASDDRSEGLSVANPSSFGQDSCGRIYVASLGGAVSRLVGSSPTDCDPPEPPADPPHPDTAPDPVGDPDPGLPGPFVADVDPPELELTAPDKQGLGRDRRLVCRVRPDEESDVVARLAILSRSGARRPSGGDGVLLRLGERELHAGGGERVKISWQLDIGELRALRRVLANDPVFARFRARAEDLAGNRSERREAISAL